MSGRDLYWRLAVGLLEDREISKNLKLFQGSLTARATRQRIQEFQANGLLEVIQRQSTDLRTKQAIPTAKFVDRLNLHLDLLMQMCEVHFLMIKKSKSM